MTPPDPDAALDALADALAPRLFERLKRLAAEEWERSGDDQATLEFLKGLGYECDVTPVSCDTPVIAGPRRRAGRSR